MTALNVTFAAPNGPYANRSGDVTAALNQAFNAWMSHFDAPQGAVTVNVTFSAEAAGYVASAAPDYIVRVGSIGSKVAYMSAFAAEIATGAPLSAAARTASLNIDPGWFATYFANPAASTGEIQRVLQHEIGHMLGFIGLTSTGYSGPVVSPYYTTAFDSYLRFNGTTETFVGPNAVAAYGRAVTMDYASVDHPYVPGRVSLMSYLEGARTIQPLDVAVLRDTGLPILSDQEVREHQVTRLYQAALGRAPDGPGLLYASHALQSGASLTTLAAGFIGSGEFIRRYGANLPDGAYVDALYQNVLHRAGDASGVRQWTAALGAGMSRAEVLVGFAESGENRNALQANPNLSYSETAEAQVERLYDTAFGRAPDSAGFANWTGALINGVTLQQAAASFISGPEYGRRYGAAVTNGQLVDALYQNTLHRTADAAGRARWLDLLNNGMSRADVVVAFSESAEHVGNVIRQDTALLSSGYLADPTAHLGSIPVVPTAFI